MFMLLQRRQLAHLLALGQWQQQRERELERERELLN